MKNKMLLLTLGLIMLLIGDKRSAIAQNEPVVKTEGCKIIDEKYLAQNITIDILHKKNILLLRLTNNCTCPIYVEIDKPHIKGESQPSFHYFFKPRTRQERLIKGYNWTQTGIFLEIEPDQYVFFEVPLESIKKNDLVVPFRYSWELSKEVNKSFIVRHVLFSTDSIPSSIEERMKKLERIIPH